MPGFTAARQVRGACDVYVCMPPIYNIDNIMRLRALDTAAYRVSGRIKLGTKHDRRRYSRLLEMNERGPTNNIMTNESERSQASFLFPPGTERSAESMVLGLTKGTRCVGRTRHRTKTSGSTLRSMRARVFSSNENSAGDDPPVFLILCTRTAL